MAWINMAWINSNVRCDDLLAIALLAELRWKRT